MKKFSSVKKGADPLLMKGITYDPKDIELNKILKLVNISDKRVLEIGCGVGRVTTKVARIAKEVYAIDVDKEVLKVAKKRVLAQKLHNVKFYLVSSDKIKFPDKFFDVVLCSWCLHHISKKDKTFRQIKRVLKTNGILAIIEKSPKSDYAELINKIKPNEKEKIKNETFHIFNLAKNYFLSTKRVHFTSFYVIKSREAVLNLFDVYKVPIDRISSAYLNKFLERRKTDNYYKIVESGYIGIFEKIS